MTQMTYASAMMSSRNLCVKNTELIWPSWIYRPSRRTRAQVTHAVIGPAAEEIVHFIFHAGLS